MARPSLIDVVEAVYRLDGDGRAWLGSVASAASPHLDRGLGLVAYGYDFSRPNEPKIEPALTLGMDPEWLDAATEAHLKMPFEQRIRMYRAGACFSTSRIFTHGDRYVTAQALRARYGATDYFGMVAANPGDSGCALIVPSRDRVVLRPEVSRRWSWIAAHIASATRLRETMSRELGDLGGSVEAVMHPSGKLEHAVGGARTSEARQVLRRAAADVDAARGKLGRTDPDGALALWRGLVAGRWSLVDRFDRDGRRYLLAVKNSPSRGRGAGLTRLERSVLEYLAFGHSQKLVAYELGLSVSRVSQIASSACRKLGLVGRLEIVRFYARIGRRKRT